MKVFEGTSPPSFCLFKTKQFEKKHQIIVVTLFFAFLKGSISGVQFFLDMSNLSVADVNFKGDGPIVVIIPKTRSRHRYQDPKFPGSQVVWIRGCKVNMKPPRMLVIGMQKDAFFCTHMFASLQIICISLS